MSAAAPRLLMALRWKLGQLFGWDRPDRGIGTRVRTLRDRLPADLRDGERGPDLPGVPLTSVYQTHDEWAAEIANQTVHGVLHIGWVPDGSGGYRGRMAVLVKPTDCSAGSTWPGSSHFATSAYIPRSCVRSDNAGNRPAAAGPDNRLPMAIPSG
nr:DUF2867 domain-containing protein [Fodinicola acaciae]